MGLRQRTPQSFPRFTARENESGVRVGQVAESLPKLWEEDEITERSAVTAAVPASTRTQARPRLTIMTGVRAGEVIALDGSDEFIIGRSRSADIRMDEQGVSRAHCRLLRCEGGFLIEDLGSMNGMQVNGVKVESARVGPGDRIQIGARSVLQLKLFDDAEETLARRIFEASTRDPLTRAFSRRYFAERLQTELAYARRHGNVLAVMLLDLDFFKVVNDTAGHAAGDKVLQEVAAALTRCVRTEDVVARHGGEEFAILVRASSRDAVGVSAERVRSRIESLQVAFGDRTLRVTTSIGVAELGECSQDASVDELIGLADRRLYSAKSLGRNRVCLG